MNNLAWLQDWYLQQCDGDWEHEYGIKITTVDNPGWYIEIDLCGTPYENLSLDPKRIEINETDWFDVRIEDQTYLGSGDPNKLEFLLDHFKTLILEGIGRKG